MANTNGNDARGDGGHDRSSLPTDESKHESGGPRKNPPLTPGVEQLGTGGLSASGGVAGGARGNSGTSDDGAGGPDGESRGGPGEYKSTSRGDLDPTSD